LKAATLGQIGNYQSTQALVSNPGAPQPSNVPGICGSGPGVWGGLAYCVGPLGDLIYYCGSNGPLQALLLNARSIQPARTAAGALNQTPQSEQFPNEGGVIPVVSSNKSAGGTAVVWAILRPDGVNQIHLSAYDAADLTKGNLFNIAAGSWAGAGGNAFLAPVVVNGKVYVASDRLSVYGVIPNSVLIQSSFGTPAHLGNFEALIVQTIACFITGATTARLAFPGARLLP
jgi:hypothetical protein